MAAKTRGRFRALWVVMAALGMLFIAVYPLLYARQLLIQHWRRDLEVLPIQQATQRVVDLTQLGDDGALILVELLEHPREEVASTARELLDRQVAGWRLLDDAASSMKVARLMRRLAEHVDRYQGEGRRIAAQLAHEVLFWPFDRKSTDVVQVLSDCEIVLRTVAAKDPPRGAAEPGASTSPLWSQLPAELLSVPAHPTKAVDHLAP